MGTLFKIIDAAKMTASSHEVWLEYIEPVMEAIEKLELCHWRDANCPFWVEQQLRCVLATLASDERPQAAEVRKRIYCYLKNQNCILCITLPNIWRKIWLMYMLPAL